MGELLAEKEDIIMNVTVQKQRLSEIIKVMEKERLEHLDELGVHVFAEQLEHFPTALFDQLLQVERFGRCRVHQTTTVGLSCYETDTDAPQYRVNRVSGICRCRLLCIP